MKIINQIQSELKCGKVYETKKFVTALYNKDICTYASVGYYHDGENITNIKIELTPNTIIKRAKKFPYIIWYQGE